MSSLLPTAAEGRRLVEDALDDWRDGNRGAARVRATYAGALAHGTDAANPFDPHRAAELHAAFAQGAAGGAATEIPRAEVIRPDWQPRPGTTHAARAAQAIAGADA